VKIKILFGGLLSALALPWQAAAANTEYSDLWWNPNESGWGVGLQRQDDVIFLTLFVYGANGNSTWFVSPNVQLLTTDSPSSTWEGPLYRATGPGFAAQFDQTVQATETGSARLQFTSGESGTFTYTVDGVQVVKQISRMTLRQPSAAGSYHGGFSTKIEQCGDVRRIGAYDFLGSMTVTQTDGAIRIAVSTVVDGGVSSCTFTGNTRQAGRLGFWAGAFNCSIYIGLDERGENPVRILRHGTFTADRVAVTQSGFRGVLTAADQDCSFSGYVGGTRTP